MIRGIWGGRIFHDDEDREDFLGRVGLLAEIGRSLGVGTSAIAMAMRKKEQGD
jgi:hypothetical protein